ncbi:MAG: hypothetical protein COW18_13485 [Zetaproteobacteria bacterium CG12_big_fil_rev_8_21_14_0_65_54_13]|nr:MAG: hypothetical protein COX55_09260 [Zetaproteobacteria bacterium CG23_combo_of_CG06-09_8_20_14_all_54_7]PIW44207.1 MAG: hypothetical protein COW18_13485 [Zetaproteobacteria bacterium CG12_big_fil_rev_8_21_14_0_65_54_13]PIX54463.1 MAG: hypothetical protein COZ50_07765 [Zetaproteobacteria bacterium CG_4_10_14_3_um_filter_54_28]PJA26954.1 MAG: hypothetical protein CO188_13425 [Zetaproteobacteria bacterium CG_4_9_14_3_um_filter_54_145]
MAMAADEDDDLFAEAMGRVRPLPAVDKVLSRKRLPRGFEIAGRQPRNATPVPTRNGSPARVTDQEWVLVADGISRERLKRLSGTQSAAAGTFDLHGMTRDAALDALLQGFTSALAAGARVLCVIHGRGLHSSDGKPVLKQAVYHWLSEGPFAAHVLAVVPQPGSGGGACLVLLRRMGP